jgi:mono/diheme cytochrome c family protein
MAQMRCAFVLFSVVLLLLVTSCGTKTAAPEKPVHALAEDEYFATYIRPLFASRCVSCHRGQDAPAGLSLVQRSGLYAPRRKGRAYVVPGDPAASLLMTAVEPGGSHPRTMPLVALTEVELGALYEWIEDGAYWPDNPAGFVQPAALRPGEW